MNCPVCRSGRSLPLYKGSFYILKLCLSCSSNFQDRFDKPSKDYNMDYFQREHQKTYGKTYLEDEENIRAVSKRRLHTLSSMLPQGGRILDVGSAMGLFCDEAMKMGFAAEGVEISEYARNYAVHELKIKCHAGLADAQGPYDAITLWFTIEHTDNPGIWLKKINGLLKAGGVLALAVPNPGGAFARFNPSEYYKKRPEEHFFEPSRKGLKVMLVKSGFRLEKIEYFGLHPQRLGLPGLTFFRYLQKTLNAGDTFEVYARKTN
jgi:cyclopropane fatty-acyl-phospholipid synthase-like methyltransferase